MGRGAWWSIVHGVTESWTWQTTATKARYLKLMNLAHFLSGNAESFLWYAVQLSGISILFFHFLSPLKVHHWGWLPRLRIWQLKPAGLYPESPQAHPKERVEADTLTAETSFGCWYGKQHFSSHFKVASDSPRISKLKTLRITGLGKIKFNWPHYSSDNLNSSYSILTTKPQCLFIILLVLGVCVLCVSRSVVSDALRPHGLYPSKLQQAPLFMGFSRHEHWNGLGNSLQFRGSYSIFRVLMYKTFFSKLKYFFLYIL